MKIGWQRRRAMTYVGFDLDMILVYQGTYGLVGLIVKISTYFL